MSKIDFQNIDCFVRMKQLADSSISLIITDPPYGIDFKGQTSDTAWDSLSTEEYYNLLINFLTEAKRILKDDGTIWMCCGRTMIQTAFSAISDCGLCCNMENWLTYVRAKGRGSKNKLKSQCEEVLHITKGKKYYWNPIEYLREVVVPYVKDGKPRGWAIDQNTGMRVRWSGVGNALFFTSPFFKCLLEPQIHSTQKPFLLWTELIMLSSKPGDLIMDPFAGSASSAVAANACDRDYIGCELDPVMYKKADDWLHNINLDEIKTYIQSRIKYMSEPDRVTLPYDASISEVNHQSTTNMSSKVETLLEV